MNPEARYSLWSSMNNIQSDMLPIVVPPQADCDSDSSITNS